MLLSACRGVGVPSTPVIVDNGNNASSNVNSNDANSNDNTNSNTNGNGNSNTNDSGMEIVGVVEVITEDTVRINGVTYQLANLAEFTDLISVGDQINFHLVLNEDGTFTILQLEIITADDNGSNNANSNDANSNDDNSNEANTNDANSNDDNGNDDDDDNDNGGNDNG